MVRRGEATGFICDLILRCFDSGDTWPLSRHGRIHKVVVASMAKQRVGTAECCLDGVRGEFQCCDAFCQ